tara:strand:+ start:3683 stop:4378 length:696 start_codon:yes stop_codon:yes gene_type:complete
MLEKLLRQLFEKIDNERDNDKKTKNGNAIYFIERVLEEKFSKPNYISSKTLKGYFEKYVEGKENNSGEPSTELKNLIAQYLNFENYLDFENKNSKGYLLKINKMRTALKSIPIRKLLLPAIITASIGSGLYINAGKNGNCIIWKENHYEIVECSTDFSTPMLKNVDYKNFKKIEESEINEFFINGKPVIWYGKSTNGEFEYFNSRGVHPITGNELKPITKYIINKHIINKV